MSKYTILFHLLKRDVAYEKLQELISYFKYSLADQ
jgi:hypothetical protein